MAIPTYRVEDDRGVVWEDGYMYASACDDADERALARPGVKYSVIHQKTDRAEYVAYVEPAPAPDMFAVIHE